MRLFATIAAFALAQDESECGPDMLEYEGFCMDKTQENMEMIHKNWSLWTSKPDLNEQKNDLSEWRCF